MAEERAFTIGRVSEPKADLVDDLLMRLSQGLIALAPGAEIVAFLRHDGIIPAPSEVIRDADADDPIDDD